MLGPNRNSTTTSSGGSQKFVILQSRPQTPNANVGQSTQQQVKINQSNVSVVQQKSHIQQNSGTKLVVVCMANSGHTNTSTVSQVNSCKQIKNNANLIM